MIAFCDKIIEYSFYLLFTLVPLILTPWNYEIFEFNKMLLTYLLTTIIVAAWLVKMLLTKKFIFRRTPLDLVILLFFVFQLASTIFSIDRHTSFFGYYSRFNGGLLSITSYILLYYAFVSNMTIRYALYAMRYTLCSAGVIASYGIAQHFGIDAQYWVQDVKNRVFSTLGQPNWLAAYLVGLSPLAWGFVLLNYKLQITNYKLKFKIQNFFYYLLFTIYYLCLLYTKSRSGFLGFGLAYLVFWSLVFLKKRKSMLKMFILFSILYSLFSIIIGTPWTPSIGEIRGQLLEPRQRKLVTSLQPLSSPEGGTESGEIRKIVWKGAIEIFRHHPWLGTGPETFAYSYYWYRPREHNDTSEWDFLYNKAHNEYLNYLATTGILGLGSYLLLIASFIFWNLKQISNCSNCSNQIPNSNYPMTKKLGQLEIRLIRTSLLAGYLGLLICHFLGFSVVVTNLFFFLFPAMSFVLTEKTKEKAKKMKSLVIGHWSLVILIFLSCSILYSLFSICRFWYADFLFAKGKKYLRTDATSQALIYFQKADALNAEPLFANELANAASLRAAELYQLEEATAAAQLAIQAIEKSDQALKTSPYQLQYWKTRTKIFYNLAEIDKEFYGPALETLIHATKLAPTDAKIFYNLGLLYYHQAEKDKAIETLKKTLELKPNYEEASKKLEEWRKEIL